MPGRNASICLSRELSGVGVRDHEPDIVANDLSLLDAERTHQPMNAGGGRLHVEAVLRDLGVADSGQIGSDDSELIREQRQEWTPHARVLRVSVYEDDGGAVAGREVVQFQAVDIGGSGGDGSLSVGGDDKYGEYQK
jgi:hypothetical protein